MEGETAEVLVVSAWHWWATTSHGTVPRFDTGLLRAQHCTPCLMQHCTLSSCLGKRCTLFCCYGETRLTDWVSSKMCYCVHSELSVGMTTEGIEVRSVGNSMTLHETALVEAFNLKAAIEYQLKNCKYFVQKFCIHHFSSLSLSLCVFCTPWWLTLT